MVTVNIPMPDYLQAFLRTKAKRIENNAIRFADRSEYNLLLLNLIGTHGNIRPCSSQNIQIILPYNEVKNILCYNKLSFHDEVKFREAVRCYFNFEYTWYVIRKTQSGMPRKVATLDFLQKINCNDSQKYDALYRAFSRMKEKIYA